MTAAWERRWAPDPYLIDETFSFDRVISPEDNLLATPALAADFARFALDNGIGFEILEQGVRDDRERRFLLRVATQAKTWHAPLKWVWHRRTGGRPTKVNIGAVITLLYAAATIRWGTSLTALPHVWRLIGPELRAQLGLPEPQVDPTNASPELTQENKNFYDDCWRLLNTLHDSVDPYFEYPRNERLTKDEVDAVVKQITGPDRWLRYLLITEMANKIVTTSVARFPRWIRRRFDFAIGIDDTPILQWAQVASLEVEGTDTRASCLSSAIYARVETGNRTFIKINKDGTITRKTVRSKEKWVMAFDCSLPVAAARSRRKKREMPLIALGLALHRPSTDVRLFAQVAIDMAAASLNLLTEPAAERLREEGEKKVPKVLIGGDQGFFPTALNQDLRERGFAIIGDLSTSDADSVAWKRIGTKVKTTNSGVVVVDGRLCCTEIPKHLVEATFDFIRGKITYETWEEYREERLDYLWPPHGLDWNNGVRGSCPALRGRLECSRRATDDDAEDGDEDKTVPVPDQDEEASGKRYIRPKALKVLPTVCTQLTVRLSPGKWVNAYYDIEVQSPEWRETFPLIRNCCEGLHGIMKGRSHEDLGDPAQRRSHGLFIQTLLVAIILAVANHRRLREFISEAEEEDDGVKRTKATDKDDAMPMVGDPDNPSTLDLVEGHDPATDLPNPPP